MWTLHHRQPPPTVEMRVPISLAIITMLLHHLLPMVASAHHTIVSNSSTGFSFPLIANKEDLDHTIHRGDDGFMYLQHNLGPDMITPLNMLHELSIRLDNNPHEYILKVDSSSVSWIQCQPCQPQARQYSPIYDPAASLTFHNVSGRDPVCQPPFRAVFSGRLCNFDITIPGGMSIEGFLAREKVQIVRMVHPSFLIGCSHYTENFDNQNRYAGVFSTSRAPTSLVMQVAASTGVTRFSYCLFRSKRTSNRQGFLRFGTDIPSNPDYLTTKILPALNDHEFEYHISLIGISLGTLKLDKIRPEMFARSKDGQGGCVVDLGTSLTMMVQEAYDIVEEAVWSELQSDGAERVKQSGFNLCFRATKDIMRRLQPLSLHFPEEKAMLVLSPEQLFLTMNDGHGKISCLAMTPGHRTVVGAFQQVDTRLVYDVKDSTLSFVSESCAKDTAEME
jgi:aspartyl protease family protein